MGLIRPPPAYKTLSEATGVDLQPEMIDDRQHLVFTLIRSTK